MKNCTRVSLNTMFDALSGDTGFDKITMFGIAHDDPETIVFGTAQDASAPEAINVFGIVKIDERTMIIGLQRGRYKAGALHAIMQLADAGLKTRSTNAFNAIVSDIDRDFFLARKGDDGTWSAMDVTNKIGSVEILDDHTMAVTYSGTLLGLTDADLVSYLLDDLNIDWVSRGVAIDAKSLLMQAPKGYVGNIADGILIVYNARLEAVGTYEVGPNTLVKVMIDADGTPVPGKVTVIDGGGGASTFANIGMDASTFFGGSQKVRDVYAPPVGAAK